MDSINNHIAKFSVFIDSNVLHQEFLRDLILRLSTKDTFIVRWSDDVLRELRASLQKVPLTDDKIENLIELLQSAFPDAAVTEYVTFIDGILVKDLNDRHIVAAAMRGGCEVIVTNNVKDFAGVEAYNIDAQHPDVFLFHHYALEPTKTIQAIHEHIASMKRPPLTSELYLERLANDGAVAVADKLREDGALKIGTIF
jgi:predicted nucleic acid-binding protein